MKRAATTTATAPLLYWLLLVCGLAAFSVRRASHFGDEVVPLWVATVAGTALGQGLARWRFRLWASALVGIGCFWIGLAFWWGSMSLWACAFPVAMACGYASFSERASLGAFWFPTLLWMLSVLDRGRSHALADTESWTLLALLAASFVAFLRAKETRRVALWQAGGTSRVGVPGEPTTLRRDPRRAVSQALLLAAVSAGALLLTAWIAPKLWEEEGLGGHPTAGQGSADCCPAGTSPQYPTRSHVRDYLPLSHPFDEEQASAPAPSCVVCGDAGVGTSVTRKETADYSPRPAWPRAAGSPVSSQEGAATRTNGGAGESFPLAGPQPKASPSVEAIPRAPPHATAAGNPPHRGANAPSQGVVLVAAPVGPPVLAWLAWLVGGWLLFQLAARPLRRSIVLRHLRAPLWPETVEQRVSNLWQLALVGLRDAGWTATPGEQPFELARRVGIEGLSLCAIVLERARHGVRVDRVDLASLERNALATYDEARQSTSRASRALAWFRWPLA